MRILILTGKFGMGHWSASQSLRQQLLRAFPGAEVEVLDLVAQAMPNASEAMYKCFNLLVTRGSGLFNLYYKLTRDLPADTWTLLDDLFLDELSGLMVEKGPAIENRLYHTPVLVIDHHETPDDLDFPHQAIIETRPACADLVFQIAQANHLNLPQPAAEALYAGISSDTLGLVSASVTSDTMRTMAALIDLGVSPAVLDERRREFMKKSPRILDYKADLIKRVEYSLDGRLATVHIPFEEIQQYSDEYNPNVLILEELRLVEHVEVAVAIKTYPDGKLTGKIRTSVPIADQIAGYFGGGGHPYAAGFRTYDTTYDATVADLISMLPPLLAATADSDTPQDNL